MNYDLVNEAKCKIYNSELIVDNVKNEKNGN